MSVSPRRLAHVTELTYPDTIERECSTGNNKKINSIVIAMSFSEKNMKY